MSAPRVSIAIPTYNQAQWIGQAVRSALAQDYAALEVIVVDDASTDPAVQTALTPFRSDPRLRIERNARNLGRAANYRHALYDLMSGDWVLMLDGDDYLIDSTYVRRAMAHLDRDARTVLAFGGCRMLSGDHYRDHLPEAPAGQGVDMGSPDDTTWLTVEGRDYFLRWGVWLGVPHQSALYRRALALDLDFYGCNIISCDWESLRRLILHGRVLMDRRPVAVWRRHAGGASNDVGIDARVADLQSINNPYLYAQSCGMDMPALDQWRQTTLADYAIDTYRVGQGQLNADDLDPLLEAIAAIDPESAQRARQVIYQSPNYKARRMLLRALGAERYRRLMQRMQLVTWKRITY